MIDWKQELGKNFLENDALSYIVTDDALKVSWGTVGKYKPQIDMVVFYKNHVRIIELKETSSIERRKVRTPQIERYYYLCKDTTYHTQFWVYMYWKSFHTIVGARIDNKIAVRFFVVKNRGVLDYWVEEVKEIGPIKKQRVDFIMKV